MTFEQVLVFHKIIDAGSFRMAAAELNKTQPAISFSIKKLEEEIGAELFDRSGYRPVLTEHGKAFYEKSQRAVQGMHELEGLTRSFQQNEEPEIAVSVDGISPVPQLLRLLKNFGDRFPNTKLNMNFDILSECERRVLSKEVQIGLTHFISDQGPLEVLKVAEVKMLPVIDKILLEEKKVFSQEKLMEIDQVVIGDKNKTGKASFGLLEGGRKWRLSDANLKKEIIFAGLGWGHMPLHYVEREIQENKLVVLDFPDVHVRTLDIHLIRLKKHQFGPVAKALWEALSSISHGPSL